MEPAYTINDGAGRIRQDFDTWGAFVDFARQRTTEVHETRCWSRNPGHSDPLWSGTRTWDAALQLAVDGWPEGERHIAPLTLDLFDRLATLIERPYYVFDVEGQDFDVARVVEGEPECWQQERTVVTEGTGRKVVRLVADGFVSAGIDRAVIIARGAAICALAQLLEYAGHGAQIDLCYAGSGHGRGLIETCVRVKDADQPLDLPRAAFALAHPSSFRRIGFSVMEALPAWARRYFGIPAFYTSPAYPEDKGDVFIQRAGLYDGQWSSPEAARAWIIEQLKAQGVAVHETDRARD